MSGGGETETLVHSRGPRPLDKGAAGMKKKKERKKEEGDEGNRGKKDKTREKEGERKGEEDENCKE